MKKRADGEVEWCYPFTSTIFWGLLNDGLLWGCGPQGVRWEWDGKKLMYVNREKIV